MYKTPLNFKREVRAHDRDFVFEMNKNTSEYTVKVTCQGENNEITTLGVDKRSMLVFSKRKIVIPRGTTATIEISEPR